MKKFVSGMVLVLMVGWFISCTAMVPASLAPTAASPYLQSSPDENIIGTVRATFESRPVMRVYGIPVGRDEANQAAYSALLEAAQREFQGNVDIRDITWVMGQRVGRSPMMGFTANGRVVMFGSENVPSAGSGVEAALTRAAGEVSENFTARSRLAIVYIAAEDRSQTDFIAGELEHILRRRGFVIIDRSELERIRAEQHFGISGEVDDSTAARIGNIAGASVVITGRVDGEGNLRRLRLRALETSSGQVIGTASERL